MTTDNTGSLATMGFVVQCLAQGVITNAELRAWAEEALVAGEDCPLWAEGLAEFDGPAGDVVRALGFAPGRVFSPVEVAALETLRALRAGGDQAAAASPAASPDACQAVFEEFRRTFPWLKLATTVPPART